MCFEILADTVMKKEFHKELHDEYDNRLKNGTKNGILESSISRITMTELRQLNSLKSDDE